MHDLDLTRPQRQEPAAVVVNFFQHLRAFANGLIGLFVLAFVKPALILYLLAVFFLGLVFVSLMAWLQYKRFTFHLEENELVVKQGVFVRERTTIPFSRIQSVHHHRNFIQRILSLTGVKVETAGGQQKELEISALQYRHAIQLREALEAGMEQSTKTDQEEPSERRNSQGASEASGERSAPEKRILVHLTLSKLFLVALTENHFKNGLIAVAVIFGYLSQFQEFFSELIYPFIEPQLPDIGSTFYLALTIILAFLIVSVLISTIRTLLQHYDLKAYLSARAFHVSSGLLKRNEYSIPLRKIQFLEWYSNFVRKIPGFDSVFIHQGGSQEQRRQQSVEIPGCFTPQSNRVMKTVFPEWEEGEGIGTFYPETKSYTRFLLALFWTPGIGFALLSSLWISLTGILTLLVLYMLGTAFWIVKYVRSVRLMTNGDLLVHDRGWLFPRRTVLKVYKIQNLRWHRTIFQQYRGTSNLTFSTAAGDRTVRFLPLQLVQEFHNYLLYRVETTRKSWM